MGESSERKSDERRKRDRQRRKRPSEEGEIARVHMVVDRWSPPYS